MTPIKLILLFLLLLDGAVDQLQAQMGPDLKILGANRKIEIPFQLENDFIIVSVIFNKVIPMRFIVDTGAEHSLLLDKTVADALKVNYQRTFDIMGADMSTVLKAHLATGISLRFSNELLVRNRNLLVLERDYFNIRETSGVDVQGILGADFFMRFVLEFDFRRKNLILHDPATWKDPGRRYEEVPVEFYRNRPFLTLPVDLDGSGSQPQKLLLDTGAGLGLLLHTGNDRELEMPETVIPFPIARGLGGSLTGSVGRARAMQLGSYDLGGVVTHFQKLPERVDTSFLNERDGILGTQILSRFKLVVDYARKKVYIRPTRKWRSPWRFDRSGLSVSAGGQDLRNFVVLNVLPGSPAERADIRRGDMILKVNGLPANFITLGSLTRRLEGRKGKKIRLRIARGTLQVKKEFRLEELL
ncbi:MAG: aspartyl protease family protein [Saprospiraceae bacterium]